jgi:hypothetical protein
MDDANDAFLRAVRGELKKSLHRSRTVWIN